MTHKNRHTLGERIALNNYLNDYDENLSFQDILDDISGEQSLTSTSIQEYYTDWYGETLAEHIQELADKIDAENDAPQLLKLLKLIDANARLNDEWHNIICNAIADAEGRQ